jgi:hypothetical protein
VPFCLASFFSHLSFFLSLVHLAASIASARGRLILRVCLLLLLLLLLLLDLI